MVKQQVKYVMLLISIVLISTFLCDKLVYLGLNRISDKVMSGQRVGKFNHYLSLKDSVDVVLFGSSKVNHNVNPSLLEESTFNMGLNRRSIACAAALVKLLPKDKKQVVLLQVDGVDIFNPRYQGQDVEALLPMFHRNSTLKKEIKKAGVKSWVNDFFWCSDYNGVVLGILKNSLLPRYDHRSYNGYDPIVLTEIQKQIFKNEVESTPVTMCNEDLVLKVNHTYLRYLREISSFCKANNKVLVAFTAPEFIDFCSVDNLKIENLMSTEEIQFVDFTNSLTSYENLEFWKDFGHLSHKGSMIFTPIFKTGIDSVLNR